MITEAVASENDQRRDELTGRVFQSALATTDILSMYLGHKLGYYQALAGGPLTSTELAEASGTVERYAREWLEQQAATGILAVDSITADEGARRYSILGGHEDVLISPDSFNYMVPLAQVVGAICAQLPAVLECFRSGGGVSWGAFGVDMREGQEGFNRPLFRQILTTEYLPSLPAIHGRLQADPPATVADICCGAGWSTIAIAKAYPKVRVTGFDLDADAIAVARRNAVLEGVGDRVSFEVRDVADPSLDGSYDLMTMFEALHDLSRPVEVLAGMRRRLKDGGRVLLMDEKVAETFTVPADPIERFMYGASVFCCLPGGMADQPSAATGTVIRPGKVREYAGAAGFSAVDILPLQHDCFRFYEIRP